MGQLIDGSLGCNQKRREAVAGYAGTGGIGLRDSHEQLEMDFLRIPKLFAIFNGQIMQVGATALIRHATNGMLTYAQAEDRWDLYLSVRKKADQIKPIDSIYICLYHEDRNIVTYVFLSDKRGGRWENGETRPGTERPVGGGPASEVIRTRTPLLLGAPEDRPPGMQTELFCSPVPSQSCLHIPIATIDGRILGVLGLFSYQPNAFDSFFIATYQMIATWLAICLDGAEVGSGTEEATSDSVGVRMAFSREELTILVLRGSGYTPTSLLEHNKDIKRLGLHRKKFFETQRVAFGKIEIETKAPHKYIRRRLQELELPLTMDGVEMYFHQTNVVLDNDLPIIENKPPET